MKRWPSTRARRVLAALVSIGWTVKRQSGSHRTLARPGWRGLLAHPLCRQQFAAYRSPSNAPRNPVHQQIDGAGTHRRYLPVTRRGAASKLILRRVPVASASRSSVLVDGQECPPSKRATADWVVFIR